MNKETIDAEIQSSSNDQTSPTQSNPRKGISITSIIIDDNNDRMISSEKMKSIMSKVITQEQKAATGNTSLIAPLCKPSHLHLSASLSPHRNPYEYIPSLLLPPKTSKKKKTLVLDLDETLVHSCFDTPMVTPDLHLTLDVDGQKHEVYVMIRPGVSEFLKKMAELYELVLFTASLSTYANPVMNHIDKEGCCAHRLFREHCTQINKSFIKDLKKLNRLMKDIMLLDNSPIAYAFNKDNGLPISNWYDDKTDRELSKITPVIEFLAKVDDVRNYIPKIVIKNEISIVQAQIVIQNYHLAGDNMIRQSLSPSPPQHSPLYNYNDKSPIVQLYSKSPSLNTLKRNNSSKSGQSIPLENKQSLKLKLSNFKVHQNTTKNNIKYPNQTIACDSIISTTSMIKTSLNTNNTNNNAKARKHSHNHSESEADSKKFLHNDLKSFQTLNLNEKERQRKRRDTKNNLLPKHKGFGFGSGPSSPLFSNQINHYTSNIVNPYPNIEGIRKHTKSLSSFFNNNNNNESKNEGRKTIDCAGNNITNKTMNDYYDRPSTGRIIDVIQQNNRQCNRTSSNGFLFNSGSVTSLAGCPSIIPLINNNNSTSNINANAKGFIKSTKQSTSLSHHVLIAKNSNRNNKNNTLKKQKYSSISSTKYAALNKD